MATLKRAKPAPKRGLKRDLAAELDELKAEVEWLKRLLYEVRTMKRGRE